MQSPAGNAVLAIWLLAGLLASAPGLAQKMYKWVDEDGNIHYSDQVPPDEVEHARERLNQQGVVVDRVDRAPTPEELAAAEARREAERAAEEQARRQRMQDQKMLSTYATEEDILRTRDQQIDALDRSIRAAQAFIRGQRNSLAGLLERAAQMEQRGQSVSDALQSSIDSVQEQIAEQQAYIAEKEQEKAEIAAFYETELARFKEIVDRRRAEAESDA